MLIAKKMFHIGHPVPLGLTEIGENIQLPALYICIPKPITSVTHIAQTLGHAMINSSLTLSLQATGISLVKLVWFWQTVSQIDLSA